MSSVIIINGPNLNLLGKREEKFYGRESFDKILQQLRSDFKAIEIDYFQSNSEGEIVDKLQAVAEENYKGLIINAGALSHYSIAILDALHYLQLPKVEVHLSNIYAREEFRRHSVVSAACDGVIAGFGKNSYQLALQYLLQLRPTKIGFK